jgi:hypothetical protein
VLDSRTTKDTFIINHPVQVDEVSVQLKYVLKKVQSIWIHFTRLPSGKKCNHCPKVYQLKTTSYHLRGHLEKIHNIGDAEVLRRRLATSPTEPRHHFELKEFEELLTKFIATSCLSLRIVDSPDFRSPSRFWNANEYRQFSSHFFAKR